MKSTIQTVSPVILDIFYIHCSSYQNQNVKICIQKMMLHHECMKHHFLPNLFDRSDKHLQSAYTAFSKQKIPIDYTKSINFLQALPSPPDKVS